MNENDILENENIITTVPDYFYEDNIEEFEEQNIDYSSILLEMNTRLENIEANTVDYTEAFQGLLKNTYFLCLPCYTFFVFCLLVLVIKFFKIFF